jgi:chlorophyllide a oxygenase
MRSSPGARMNTTTTTTSGRSKSLMISKRRSNEQKMQKYYTETISKLKSTASDKYQEARDTISSRETIKNASFTKSSSQLTEEEEDSNDNICNTDVVPIIKKKKKRKGLSMDFADDSSLLVPDQDSSLRNFWYPITFASKLEKEEKETEQEQQQKIECKFFGETWVIKKRECVKTQEMKWVCVNKENESVVLPSAINDGLFMVWPGKAKPTEELPEWFKPPSGYTVHAELVIEDVPVDAALLMENLLDLAHAPFTHTGTFAKGWGVPNFVEFATKQLRKPGDGWHDMATFLSGRPGGGSGYSAEGSWKPYPIDMKFITPCMVDSHIGMAQPGAAGAGMQFEEGDTCATCDKHLHQLHVCVPQEEGKTRLLYRMSLDFAKWAKWVPGIQLVWMEMANQVLGEDLRLVEGQQDRMSRGGRVWANPVQYDKIGLVYRNWRNHVSSQNTSN